jgi:hypothetical protein
MPPFAPVLVEPKESVEMPEAIVEIDSFDSRLLMLCSEDLRGGRLGVVRGGSVGVLRGGSEGEARDRGPGAG